MKKDVCVLRTNPLHTVYGLKHPLNTAYQSRGKGGFYPHKCNAIHVTWYYHTTINSRCERRWKLKLRGFVTWQVTFQPKWTATNTAIFPKVSWSLHVYYPCQPLVQGSNWSSVTDWDLHDNVLRLAYSWHKVQGHITLGRVDYRPWNSCHAHLHFMYIIWHGYKVGILLCQNNIIQTCSINT